MDQVITPQVSQPTPEPKVHSRGGFFVFLGKLFLFLLLGLLLVGGGYFWGMTTQSSIEEKVRQAQLALTITSPTPQAPSPTQTSQNTKQVTAGLTGSTAFSPYRIDLPADWTDARETTVAAGIDKLTIAKTGYLITIYQAPMGGGGCLYKGDPTSTMAQEFTEFANIHGKSGEFRRSWNPKDGSQTISYTICQQADDNSYGSITKFGAISIVSPNPATPAILAEIDGIIASLIKQ